MFQNGIYKHPCLSINVVQSVLDWKSISKYVIICHDNELCALYNIHKFMQASIMTYNSLSRLIVEDFYINLLKLVLQLLFIDEGILQGMGIWVL